MALALRLFLLLLLAVALHARAAQAAPVGARGADWYCDVDNLEVLLNDGLKFFEIAGDEPVGEGDPAAQAVSRTEPLGDGEGVSAERTFPAPGLDAVCKPGSCRRGPPTGKNKDKSDKKSQKPSKLMRQMLKEMQQAGQEMDGEAVLKAAFLGGSSGSLAASAEGREAMSGTATGDDVTVRASPLPWLHKVLKPLELPAGVSAERGFPDPGLVAVPKPGSDRRDPWRGKNKPTRESKSQESNDVLKEIVKELQRGQGMDREALWKPAFPEGREAMPGMGSRDWDRDMEFVEKLLNGDLKFLEFAGDEPFGEGDPAAQAVSRTEPMGDGEGVSAERTFPAPGLDAARKPGSCRRGTPKGNSTIKGEKKSLKPSKLLDQMLTDLERHRGMDREVLWKAAFPEGREAMPGMATGVWVQPGAELHITDELSQEGSGDSDAAGNTTNVLNAQKGIGRGICQGTRCFLAIIAGLLCLELVFMFCCAGVWYYWKRKQHLLEEKLKAGGWSRDVYSQKSCSSGSDSDQHSFAPVSSVVL